MIFEGVAMLLCLQSDSYSDVITTATFSGLIVGLVFLSLRDTFLTLLIRFGSDLLSHALRRSTISAAALNCRVRDGIGCFARAMTTKSNEQRYRSNDTDHLTGWQGVFV